MDFSFFKTPSHQHPNPSSVLTLLKDVAASNNMLLFEAAYLYHQKAFIHLPLLLLVPQKGLLLFEILSWSADTLQGASICSWHPSLKKEKALSVDDTLEFIRQKFNYILHQDLTPTTAMVLFERLSSQEFKRLDPSFQRLIPTSRTLFNNETASSILEKITSALADQTLTLNTNTILSTLFMQYTLPPDHFNTTGAIADSTQQHYADNDFSPRSSLVGPYGSGKSTLMLLKVLGSLLRHPQQHIMIIAPTPSACDILKQKMLTVIEHAIIEVDLSTIEVITPKQLLTRHAQQLYHKPLHPIAITEKMLRKPFDVAEIIVCDDADLLPTQFIAYLQHLQQKQTLHLLCTHQKNAVGECYTLTKSYRSHAELTTLCHQDLNNQHSYENIANIKFCIGNIYMQTMLAFNDMLKIKRAGETALIITPNRAFSQALYEQMHDYIEEEIILFDAQQSMIDILFDHHIIVEQSAMASLCKEHVIVAGIYPENRLIFCHALSRGYKSISIIVHDENENDTINLICEEKF